MCIGKEEKESSEKKTEVIVCFENKVHEHVKAIVPSLYILFFRYVYDSFNKHEGNNIGINFAARCLFRGRVTFMHEMYM